MASYPSLIMTQCWTVLLYLLWWCALVRAGWWTDGSCDTLPNFIDSVNNAFDFAVTAVNLYTQRNPNVLDAANLLFDEGTAFQAILKLAGVAGIGLGGYRGVVTNINAQVGLSEVIFSCGYSTQNEVPVTYPNGQILVWEKNFQYAETADDTYYSCKDGSLDEDNLLIGAYTINWPHPPKASIIRFCPLFLAYIAKARWSSYQQIDPQWLIDIPPEAAETLAKEQATPVDLYGLLELAILHELTHTTNGGLTEDLASPVVNTVGGAGWGYVTSDLRGNAYENAESLAFMGLLSKLIQLGFAVDRAGNLRQLVASKFAMSRKRSRFNGTRT